MKSKVADEARVGHMLEAINYIEQFTDGKSRESLDQEPLLRFALERQLEIIGEASTYLSQELKDNYNSMEWKKIKTFRNVIAHEYFGIDHDLVWEILQTEIQPLKTVLLTIQNEQKFLK